MVVATELLSGLDAKQLREFARDLIAQIASLGQTITSKDREIVYRQAKIDQLTHEMAVLKRLASLGAAANNSMLPRPVCSMKP